MAFLTLLLGKPSASSSMGPFFSTQFSARTSTRGSQDASGSPLGRPDAAHSLPAAGILTDSVGQGRENYVCRPSSGASGAEMPNAEFGIDTRGSAANCQGAGQELHKATSASRSATRSYRVANAITKERHMFMGWAA